jgi:hypothetical protein
MALAFDSSPHTDGSPAAEPGPRTPDPIDPDSVGRLGSRAAPGRRFGRDPGASRETNSISASQARAARRREARRDQQAVAAWLRELSR